MFSLLCQISVFLRTDFNSDHHHHQPHHCIVTAFTAFNKSHPAFNESHPLNTLKSLHCLQKYHKNHKCFQRNPDSRNWFSKVLLFFQVSFLVKINCGCPSNRDIFCSVCLQYEAHRKLFAVLTFRERLKMPDLMQKGTFSRREIGLSCFLIILSMSAFWFK